MQKLVAHGWDIRKPRLIITILVGCSNLHNIFLLYLHSDRTAILFSISSRFLGRSHLSCMSSSELRVLDVESFLYEVQLSASESG